MSLSDFIQIVLLITVTVLYIKVESIEEKLKTEDEE